MIWHFYWTGRARTGYLREGIEDYLARIRRYVRCEVHELREEKGGDAVARVRREGNAILSALRPTVYTMALDEDGESLTTERFAELMGERESAGTKEAAFVLGGPDGLSQEVRDRASRRIGLSAMTLTHEMARLVLVEQVYRALTILRGHPYHRGGRPK